MSLSRDGRPAVQVRGALHDGAPLVLDHVLKFGSEVLQKALYRPCGGIAQRTNRVSFDAIGDIEQQP
jgi:hypothetical protein